MKNKLKKIPRLFKLESDIDSEIRLRSDRFNMSQTAIVERALKFYFRKGMIQDMAEMAKEMAVSAKSLKSSFNSPLHRLAAAMA
jgi:hypothetical protein